MTYSQIEQPQLLIDGHHGQYVPREFAWLDIAESGWHSDDIARLKAGPDDEHWEEYWDLWNNILTFFSLSIQGKRYNLHQTPEGDLFLSPQEYEWDE